MPPLTPFEHPCSMGIVSEAEGGSEKNLRRLKEPIQCNEDSFLPTNNLDTFPSTILEI